MATTIERPSVKEAAPAAGTGWGGSSARALALVSLILAAWALIASAGSGGPSGEIVRDALIVAWAIAAVRLSLTGGTPALAALVGGTAAVAAVGSMSVAARPIVFGLVPAAGLHLLLAMPDGLLRTTGRRVFAGLGYGSGAIVGILLWTQRPGYPRWPVVVEIVILALIGGVGFATRYAKAGAGERRRMKWLGWSATAAGGLAVALLGLHVLVDWPTQVGEVSAAVTALLPLSLVMASSKRFASAIDPLLASSISLAGLTAVVVAVYLGIVLGLGRVPRENERTLLVLSMVAAALAALLYLPAHARLVALAKRLVYGGRQAPDDVLRNFGSRMSRSIPLDELLLQMVESLRKTLALTSAEVWAASGGQLERAVSDPDRPYVQMQITSAEEATVARAGVSGPAWMKVWLPELLAGRANALLRVAPITHSGELLGLIVVERSEDSEQFTAEDERILTELARQVGLTLHNVRLDSALQASLDEVRRQAEALQASRGRIVAAADLARRRIERNLHDGVQQHLVALAVKVRLARQLAEKDPARADQMLQELGSDLEDALQELRDLAHGIYPPLLADKGLPEALASAARRSILPVAIQAGTIGRYSQELEAAIYFCCLEAMQNAGKYAGENARVTIRIWEEAGGLLFEVADDGAGFDVTKMGVGAGFTNMNDRLGAIGGTLRVESAPGRGTMILGTIPLAEKAAVSTSPS
jgi:signal transduction histidine kinase